MAEKPTVMRRRNIALSPNNLWLRRVESRLAKAAVGEPPGQIRDRKLHAVVARSTCRSQMYKAPQLRSTFRSCDIEKVDAIVARSTFQSKYTKHTGSDHLWKLTCRKKCTP